MKQACISHIQRFACDDGPGIRTTVFFKGCTLRCPWCHNPECLDTGVQLQFFRQRCTGCGNCVLVCPQHAQKLVDGNRSLDRARCTECFQCVDVCGAQALQRSGRYVTLAELLEEVLKDREFYHCSDGGITLSGGEPLLQWAFCRELLQALRSQDLHTAVETAGYVPYRNLAAVLPFVNLFLFDFKIADSARHEAYTGHPNVLIKANLEQLLHDGANVIVRVPLIPGVNDDAELDRISEYLRGKPVQAVEILPYHEYGRSKYASLGIEYRLPVTVAPDRQCLSAAEDLFRRNGINARAYP